MKRENSLVSENDQYNKRIHRPADLYMQSKYCLTLRNKQQPTCSISWSPSLKVIYKYRRTCRVTVPNKITSTHIILRLNSAPLVASLRLISSL